MAEYIEREAFRKKLAVGAEYLDEDTLMTVVNLLDCESAADVAPVVHGRWLYKRCVVFDCTKDLYRCSECNTTWDAESKYCPNCGARMDGE